MKPVISRRAYPLILGVLFLAAASAWAADPKRNLAVAPGTPAAPIETRVALVIGNSNYKSAPLKNPVNDAKAIAEKLQGLGFKVTLKLDQDQKSMADAIRVFGNQLKTGGAGLFYYAGHGMQVQGRNFLIPVDADIQNEDEVPYRSVDANEVLSKMETAKNRLNLMILDACRNNPFSRKFRSASQGLAQMDAPSGTLVAFATAPGSVASDGSGKNGIYTQHLLASLGQPGVPVEQLFKRVRVGVMKDTRNAQVPWESSSLVGDFYFKPGTASATADPAAIELAYWDSIKDSSSADDYKAYLKKYPNGLFADIAKRRALNPPKPATTAVASVAPTPAVKPEPSPGQIAGKVFRDCDGCPEMVVIPAGNYAMGGIHHIEFRLPFAVGKFEVTFEQWDACVTAGGCTHRPNDNGWGRGSRPVMDVSWDDARQYLDWLVKKTGKRYRLLTEVEWEYAARAGTTTVYYWGDSADDVCQYASVSKGGYGCGERRTSTVGSRKPNAFGLHDMLGNVWEWTEDCWNSDTDGVPRDGSARTGGDCGRRVLRGGSWSYNPDLAHTASRVGGAVDGRGSGIGFRLARMP